MFSGEGNEQDLMVSDDKYLDTIVSFWRILEDDERELLCLGALSGFSLLYTTLKCHQTVKESNNIIIRTGSSYFDDIDISFILQGAIELPKGTNFILSIVSNSS